MNYTTALHRTALKACLASSIGLAFAAACSSEEKNDGSIFNNNNQAGQDEDSGAGGTTDPGVGGSGFIPSTGGSPFGGGAGGSNICAGVGAAAEPLPVDMYIMFDKSTSMEEILGSEGRSKWDSAISAIQAFFQNPRAAGIGVGIQYFGQPDTCNPDVYAIPAVPIGRLPAAAADLITSTSNEVPSTLTPTAPALEGALRHMQTWAAANPERAAIVVLVTDGFPTQCGVQCAAPTDCQSNTCLNGMCDPNSISEIEALAARYAAMDPPIRTFVVGFGQGLANLDNIARGGGTGDAFLIDGGDVESQFVDAMLSISSTPLSCEFEMPVPDNADDVLDPTLVQVMYTPAATGIPEEIPKLHHAGECALNYNEGWYYDSEGDPTQILICPETCKSFAAGSVAIALGCMPEIPILQ